MVVTTRKSKMINKYQSEHISKLQNEVKKLKMICTLQVKFLRSHRQWSNFSAELITPLMRGGPMTLTVEQHLDVLKNRKQLYDCLEYIKNEFARLKSQK